MVLNLPHREWRSFQNQGRTDGLRLSHWVKAGTPLDAGNTQYVLVIQTYLTSNTVEYPFAKYNVQNPTYTYTQDEYNRLLNGG